MNRQRVYLAAAAFVLAAVLLLVWQRPAGAIDLPTPGKIADKATCKAPPEPATPDGGMMGFLVEMPDNPYNGDPFAPGATGSIKDKYGYGGLGFVTYDQGCPGQFQSAAPNWFENMLWKLPIYMTAFADQVVSTMFHPTFLGVFDPVVTNAAAAIRGGPFAALIVVTFAAVGLYIVVSAFRRSMHDALSAGGWLLLVIGVAAFFGSNPLWAVHTFDENTTMVSQAVGSGFGGSDVLVGQIHKQILYKQWLTGTFGDANSPVAQRHGHELFEAGALSWSEWKSIREGTVNGSDLIKAKQDRWQEIAEQVKNEDPIAYSNLQGNHIDQRTPRSFFAALGVLGATAFQILAGFMFVVALLCVRIFVLAWPIAVIIGAFPTKRTILVSLWGWLWGGLIAAVACVFAAGVVSVFVGAILASTELAGWLVLFLLLAVFVAAWKLLRPYRSPFNGSVGGAVKRAGRAIAAIKIGEEMVEHGVKDAERGQSQRRRRDPVAEPPPPPSASRRPRAETGAHAAGFVQERDTGAAAVGAYRPGVSTGQEQPALGRARSKTWEDGTQRIRVEEPVQPSGRRVRVESTSRTAPNPPDRVSRPAGAGKEPIDARVVRTNRPVYVPVRRRKDRETV